jgi:hypothetical protein
MQLTVRSLDAGADVEPPASPGLPGRRREGLDDVLDEDVVAGVGTVAEDRRREARQQPGREDGDQTGFAARVLPGAVDVGQRQMRAVQVVELAIGVEVHLARDLPRRVRRPRVDRCLLVDGQVLGRAVDRASRRREDDLAHPGPAGGFGHVDRADDVLVDVEQGLVDAVPDVDLPGQVEDDLGGHRGDDVDQLRAGHVELDQLEAARCRGPHQVFPVAAAKIIDGDDVVACREQPVDQRRPDEPGAAGDHCPHGDTAYGKCPDRTFRESADRGCADRVAERGPSSTILFARADP